jgi:Uma2 family endonuclease
LRVSTTARRLGGDVWLQVPATWGAYVRLLRAREDGANPRYIYRGGRLTIVSPGIPHESIKLRLSWLIETILVELGIPFLGSGAVTLKQAGPRKKGVEGDTSDYLTNLDRVLGKKTLEMGTDPPPDLEVEVVISHPVREALSVHASFGVREVWVCKRSGLTFLALGDDGRYHSTPLSVSLPFLSSEELAPWVFGEGFPDEIALRRAFRAWVVGTLAPRLRPGDQRAHEHPAADCP